MGNLSHRVKSNLVSIIVAAAVISLPLLLGGCEPQTPTDEGKRPESSQGMALAIGSPSFQEITVTNGLAYPTAMAFAPDGRLFICEQGGKLRVVKNGALLAAPFLTLSVSSNGERGLLGVAFDPDFAANAQVYVYYTTSSSPVHNRLSRFTASASNPDLAASGETVLLDLDNLSSASNHNGGAVHFGPDGKLYIAVGENANPPNAQSLAILLGKILRINSDGTIPTDNPFYASATGKNRAIWAMGLRNPFTFAFQPGTGKMLINDVGQDAWEEINQGQRGANYGWPATEGATTNPSYTTPLMAYANAGSDCAIVGADFYNPVSPQFPSDYVGDYFFGDYCGGWIKRLDVGSMVVNTFVTGISSLVDLKVGPDGSLYYLSAGSGALRKVSYTGSQAPSISQQPVDVTVTTGGSATFTVSASGAAPLAYQWQRGGANLGGATSPTYTLSPAQSADSGARFRCVVSNAQGSATSNEALLTVTSNRPPVANIVSPASGAIYQGGQVINYSGTGADPEDGDLPASAFTWQVDFHHETHTHPMLLPTSGSKSGSLTIPVNGETSSNVWYRFILTVRDGQGMTHQTFRDVLPVKADITLASSPSGLQLLLDGQASLSPIAFTGVAGVQRALDVPSPQSSGGKTWVFASWSDGGARNHVISTPASATTYTATFRESVSTVNNPPRASITSPATGTLYQGGQVINYAGTATDPQDGALTGSAFTWQVELYHDAHTHLFMAPVTGSTTGSFTIPVNGETSSNVWYLIILTVKDKEGLKYQTYREVRPIKANVTLATSPTGLQVQLDGNPAASPFTFTGVAGILRNLSVASPQSLGGKNWEFVSWSDGGARSHTVSTPSSATTYTATFQEVPPAPSP